ncbi:uncharacterized protein LOC117105555 [Anneissia japonica]|uniref:uncharacterized protein LOC117105555 n=1 Tax=Anneissia japonica TaxID=1529436 RepID=UPI0014255BAF|nr:uncharacterized protein LOC117105555 [Anneissia japonica]
MQLIVLCLAIIWPWTVLSDEVPSALRSTEIENDFLRGGFDRRILSHTLKQKHVLAHIIKSAAEDLLANEALQMKTYEESDWPSDSNVVTEDGIDYAATGSEETEVSKRGNCPGDRCLRIKKKPKQTSACSHNACLRILPFGKRASPRSSSQGWQKRGSGKTRTAGGGGRTDLRPSFAFGKKDF